MFSVSKTALAQDNREPEQINDKIIFQSSDSLLLRSESRAFNLSLWGTIATHQTIILAVPGIIVGPSLGYIYGDMPGHDWKGIGIRAVGVGGMLSSFAICGWGCGPGESAYTTAWIVFVTSAGLVVVSAVYDIASIKKRFARRMLPS